MIPRFASFLAFVVPLAAQPGPAPAPEPDSGTFASGLAATAVRWDRWDGTIAERTKTAGKPVYLFVGSELSELTRATIRETFGRAETAAWLNASFTCIAVNADTQPAVAALARHYLLSVKQLAGLPMHLWLTPDLHPYEGFNYLPPSEEWGKPGYLKSARAALDAWLPDAARARALATEARERMALPPLAEPPDAAARLAQAAADWVKERDPVNGGFGTAPKQPEPELIRFLLHCGSEARQTALIAARALATRALRDPADGGFYRRVVDDAWREPYFQKTLIDQARIALALLETAGVADDDSLRAPAYGALDFALRALRLPDGGFAAALDGTLEDPPLPPALPKFVQSGRATVGAIAQLALALHAATRTGERRFAAPAAELLEGLRRLAAGGPDSLARIPGTSGTPDPADRFALVAALRIGADDTATALAEALLRDAVDRHLDRPSGLILAPAATPGTTDVPRIPASGETPSAAALALAAGLSGAEAALVRQGLLQSIVYDTLPAGDVLWALGQFPPQSPR
jgi:uncharacterized protein YyaL (SSP411 family)